MTTFPETSVTSWITADYGKITGKTTHTHKHGHKHKLTVYCYIHLYSLRR